MESFNELNLSPEIKQAIDGLGFTKPSPIQAEALPILMGESTDFIGLAATGTGKTAAFSIPLLERINPTLKAVQGLILCPTRELALQVTGQINLLGKHKGIKAVSIYGGSSYGDQMHGLKSGASVVVGTPGRLIDHMERGTLKLKDLSVVILDEADEMISMGFKEDLEKILEGTNRESSNIWLFSATMSKGVRTVANQYLNQPKQVHVNQKEMLSTTVEQIYYATQESNKPEVLCKLIDAAEDFYGLIFCQTKSLVTDLAQFLTAQGYKVDSLHGDKDQNARERTMRAFREKKVNILICTDVASRGIDVKDITHVINYSIPRELDNYVHRIGRTARSGKTGFAMSLVTPSHRVLIGRIEQMTKSKMREGVIPSRKEIGAKKLAIQLEQFSNQKDYSRAIDLMSADWKKLIAEMPVEEIAGRFLCMIFPEIFTEREKANTMPGPQQQIRDNSESGRRAPTRSSPRPFSRPRRAERSENDSEGGRIVAIPTGAVEKRSEFSGEKPRTFGGGEKREFGGERRGGFSGEKRRTFGGGEKREFGGERRGGFSGEKRRTFGGGDKREFGGERRAFGGGDKREFGAERSGGFGEKRAFGGESRGFKRRGDRPSVASRPDDRREGSRALSERGFKKRKFQSERNQNNH